MVRIGAFIVVALQLLGRGEGAEDGMYFRFKPTTTEGCLEKEQEAAIELHGSDGQQSKSQMQHFTMCDLYFFKLAMTSVKIKYDGKTYTLDVPDLTSGDEEVVLTKQWEDDRAITYIWVVFSRSMRKVQKHNVGVGGDHPYKNLLIFWRKGDEEGNVSTVSNCKYWSHKADSSNKTRLITHKNVNYVSDKYALCYLTKDENHVGWAKEGNNRVDILERSQWGVRIAHINEKGLIDVQMIHTARVIEKWEKEFKSKHSVKELTEFVRDAIKKTGKQETHEDFRIRLTLGQKWLVKEEFKKVHYLPNVGFWLNAKAYENLVGHKDFALVLQPKLPNGGWIHSGTLKPKTMNSYALKFEEKTKKKKKSEKKTRARFYEVVPEKEKMTGVGVDAGKPADRDFFLFDGQKLIEVEVYRHFIFCDEELTLKVKTNHKNAKERTRTLKPNFPFMIQVAQGVAETSFEYVKVQKAGYNEKKLKIDTMQFSNQQVEGGGRVILLWDLKEENANLHTWRAWYHCVSTSQACQGEQWQEDAILKFSVQYGRNSSFKHGRKFFNNNKDFFKKIDTIEQIAKWEANFIRKGEYPDTESDTNNDTSNDNREWIQKTHKSQKRVPSGSPWWMWFFAAPAIIALIAGIVFLLVEDPAHVRRSRLRAACRRQQRPPVVVTSKKMSPVRSTGEHFGSSSTGEQDFGGGQSPGFGRANSIVRFDSHVSGNSGADGNHNNFGGNASESEWDFEGDYYGEGQGTEYDDYDDDRWAGQGGTVEMPFKNSAISRSRR